jgi:hypothetical protein
MRANVPSNSIMRMRPRIAAGACSIALTVVAAVPGFAQSDMGSRFDARQPILAAHAPAVMRLYSEPLRMDQPRADQPPNLIAPGFYREVIETMLERSPTFRRQSVRIANAPNVRVRLTNLYPSVSAGSRARTNIVRTAFGGLQATVEIARVEDLPELIAHEVEHIIAQLDGIDLRAQSLLPGTGVRACDDGSFETIRAIRIGVLVAREIRTGR